MSINTEKIRGVIEGKWPGDQIVFHNIVRVKQGWVAVYERTYNPGVSEDRVCFVHDKLGPITEVLAQRS